MSFIIIFCAKYLLFISIAIAAFVFLLASKTKKIKAIYIGLISSLAALIITKISAHFIYDPRPFAVKNIQPLIQHAADNGFPSDHTLVAALIASIVFTFNKKAGLVLLLIAILIGASRILAEVHHPLDIIGSIFIALISVGIGLFGVEHLTKSKVDQKD